MKKDQCGQTERGFRFDPYTEEIDSDWDNAVRRPLGIYR